MHIKELQLIGFKSFQDKSRLTFSPGMNAIIGPNGCGKTNILDALRWVLGEQSFTVLRCAKNEDLIFGGTAKVPATNYAEVRLLLANEDTADAGNELLARYGAEIDIRRRYFRSGESEYYLNQQPCRLRDIQEVFLASGIGTKAYSIFDLGQMREIISGNIRRMFEEAAALAKYRDAKADCHRKLDLTDKDLVRLDDIVAERERIVRSLKRQAGKLKSYAQLKEEEKGLRLIELKSEYDSLSRELEQADKDMAALERAEADRLVEIRRLETELQQHRGRLRQERSRKDELADEARKRREELSALEGQVLLSRQRAEFLGKSAARADGEQRELEQSIGELQRAFDALLVRIGEGNRAHAAFEEKLEAARGRTKADEQKLHGLRSQELTLRQSLEDVLERQNAARQELARLEATDQNRSEALGRIQMELGEVEQRLARTQGEETESRRRHEAAAEKVRIQRSRIEELTAALSAAEDERTAVDKELGRVRSETAKIERDQAVLRSLVPAHVDRTRQLLGENVLGELGRFLDIDKGWERAVEAALQPVADLIVVAKTPAGPELAMLVGSDIERGVGLLPVDGTESSGGEQRSDVGARLSGHVRVAERAPTPLARWIDMFQVVADEDELLRHSRDDSAGTYVTKGGCAAMSDGRLYVAPAGQSRLQAAALLKEKTAALESVRSRAAELADRRSELGVLVDKSRVDIAEAREVLVECERQRSSQDAMRQAHAMKKSELERDRQRMLVEAGQSRTRKKEDDAGLAQLKARLAEHEARAAEETKTLRQVQERIAEQEKAVRIRLDDATELLAGLNEARQKVLRIEAERDYIRRTIEERRTRIAELKQAAISSRAESESIAAASGGYAPRIEETKERLAELEAEIDRLRVADLSKIEEELEANIDELRQARETNQSLMMNGRIGSHELRQQLQAIVEEAKTVYSTDIATCQPEDVDDAEQRLAKVRSRIEALGQVNPLALDEYQQERTDLERLRSQREDVARARENLLQSMAEIDQHARERFLATYEEVRVAFQDIFRHMFLEGEADLMLVDAQNPLESEIDIVARPRGKTPKRLEQLSDGEKALLAVSLLFAFYRVKPAPFCFLDEIDAPLDDANVGRFADYLKLLSDRTQVVIITHNRLTVERADVLFGVTAEQPGVSKLVSVSLADYRRSPVASSVS